MKANDYSVNVDETIINVDSDGIMFMLLIFKGLLEFVS